MSPCAPEEAPPALQLRLRATAAQLDIFEQFLVPNAATLTRELSAFRRRTSRAGNDSYEAWRESDHDDLVLALALAAWYREYWCERLDRRGVSHVYDTRTGKQIA